MNEFCVGDEVLYIYDYDYDIGHGQELDGLIGTVCHVRDSGNRGVDIGVEFYEYVEGHNCGGHCKTGYGWYVLPESITHTKQQVEITIPDDFLSMVLEVIQ